MTIFHSSSVRNNIPLDKGEILERVSPLSIFEKYFGAEIVYGKKYQSPFRKDRDPSFVFFEGKSKIRFYDFSTGKSGDCFDFISSLYQIPFSEVLKMINQDFNLGLGDNENITASKLVAASSKKRKEKLFQVKVQKFTESDLAYWIQFGITEEILKKYKIFSLREVWLNKELYATYSNEDPIFGLYFPNTEHIKIYRPVTKFKKNKWIGNSSREDIHGENQLEYKSNTIILTSSLKDVMVLGLIGYEAIALNSEGARPSERVLSILNRYKSKYILYDNDTAGRNYAEMVRTLVPEMIIIQVMDEKTKDPSDYFREYGIEKLKEMTDGQISRTD